MDEVAEIKSRLEIAEVVGAYLPLKQAGRNLKAPCPFHQEKSASFMVSPEKGIYHCFGCSEGGDIISFVMKMEGLEFREALEKLARQAGVELKARRGEDAGAKRLRARLLEAHELAAKYFQASLVKNAKAIEYVVKKRRLNKQTIRDFQIGYAPDSWSALTDFLIKRGFKPQELLQGGLASQKQGRNTIYDMFRGRIMFTIGDREGRPIGFTGRVLDDSVPKYVNTPQTVLYDKSSAIFGLHLAKEAIRSANEVVLVEGQMDVVASHQAGVHQVVAASGTALTLEQLRTLSKLTKNIKLAFDADRAGLAATERAIELGQKLGLTLRMVELSEGKDADELTRQNPALWAEAIAGAKYIVDYLFDRFEADYDLSTAVGKRQYADRLAANLRRLGDPVEQDHYVRLLAEKVGASEEAVRAKLAQGETGSSAAGSVVPPDTFSGQRTPSVSSGGSEPALAGERASVSASPGPRAKVQAAKGKMSIRAQMEESYLGLVLLYPLTRVSLGDLRVQHFSSTARQAIFELVSERKEEPGEAVVEAAGDYAVYGKQLLMIGERNFGGLAEPTLSFEAFSLAHKVLLNANKDFKRELSRRLKEAEAAGDRAAAAELMRRYQAIIETEAA